MLSKELIKELEEFIDLHQQPVLEIRIESEQISYSLKSEQIELESYINNKRKASFAEVLFQFIDDKEYSDSDVYKKARIDRRHFSKIRSDNYRISKPTAVSLAIALQLDEDETEKLLSAAGFTLSDNDTFDLIIQFFLEKEIYDIDEVNQALDYFSLKTLG